MRVQDEPDFNKVCWEPTEKLFTETGAKMVAIIGMSDDGKVSCVIADFDNFMPAVRQAVEQYIISLQKLKDANKGN